MLHRSITFIHAAFLVTSAVLSFLVVRELHEVIPDDQASVLWIRDLDGTASGTDVTGAVESFAEQHRVNIALEAPDLHDPGGLRHLYLAVGAPDTPSGRWIEQGYPAFSPDFQTEVHPFAEAAHLDPRGFYYVFGPRESAFAVLDDLSGIGLGGFVAEENDVVNWFLIAQGRTLSATLTITILCGIVAVGAGVLLNSKSYGVLRLQGMSLLRIFLRDLAQLAKFWWAAALLITAVTTGFLAVYNGLAQFPLFLKVMLFYLAVLTTSAVAAHAAVLALIHRTGILPALKGKMPARLATVGAYSARIPALVLVLGFTGSLVLSVNNLHEQQSGRELFEEAGDASRIHLTDSVSELQEEEKADSLGEWLRGIDADGQVILVSPDFGGSVLPAGSERPDFDLLVVNDTYLATHPVLDPDGTRYGPAQRSDQVRILIPETLSDQEDAVQAGAASWVYDFQGRDNPDLDVDIEIRPSRSGQSVFTYGATGYGPAGNAPFLHDPVIIALPNGSEVLHPATYYGYATTGAAVFPDPQVVFGSMDELSLATYINGVQPVMQKAADEYQAIARQMRLEGFNLAAGTLVLLITGITVCIVHARKNAQTIFARHISGWTFLATHRTILAVEALLALAFVVWATRRTVAALNHIRDPQTPPMRHTNAQIVTIEPFLAAGIAVLSLALVLAALAAFHRRIIREGTSGA